MFPIYFPSLYFPDAYWPDLAVTPTPTPTPTTTTTSGGGGPYPTPNFLRGVRKKKPKAVTGSVALEFPAPAIEANGRVTVKAAGSLDSSAGLRGSGRVDNPPTVSAVMMALGEFDLAVAFWESETCATST